MNILLVEPNYRNKLPPLGLMKIARYHRLLGDKVLFIKGTDPLVRSQHWDKIYITTLFSFHWNITIKTISYYNDSTRYPSDIVVGGILATILHDELKIVFPDITIHRGLLNEPGSLGNNTIIIDNLVPDYTILDDISYDYSLSDSYICHTTRGCINKCKFCAVPTLEPKYTGYISIKDSISLIQAECGPKKGLLLLDNNVLASKQFNRIISDICDIGFQSGSKLNKSNRYVDFNQGIDPRLISDNKVEQLTHIAIKPLRIAFDSILFKDIYSNSIKCAARHNLLNLSNYILYNHEDTPADFYERLRINTIFNTELGTKIYSFPMKYIPTNAIDRHKFIGKHWTWKMIRGVQCILNATHGIVGPRLSFFNKAFGKNSNEFIKIINMPEDYIIYRILNESNGAQSWSTAYDLLSADELNAFIKIISLDRYNDLLPTGNIKIDELLSHYS
jgi:hypothetical protein